MKPFKVVRFRSPATNPLLLLLLLPASLSAQEEVIPVINGEVRAGGAPFPGAMVVLHQVSAEVSGEIDSIQAGPGGSFQLTLPRVPAHGVRSEVFFASVRHRGLLYFGPAITGPLQLDSLYLIQAYDTLSVPTGGADLPISVRNLFLDKVEVGWEATDFFQLRQSGDRTLFSPAEGVTWRYPLPASATDFEVGQTDLSPDAVRFEDGNLAHYAPIPPGDRFFLVRYRLPMDDFTIPLPGMTERIEILVRDPAPSVEFPPLRPTSPVELEPGNVFSRWEGDRLVDTEVESGLLPEPIQFHAEWLAVILAALLGGVGVFAFRLRGARNEGEPQGTGRNTRDGLIRRIAELDEEFERSGDRSQAARERYTEGRRQLLDRLKRLP